MQKRSFNLTIFTITIVTKWSPQHVISIRGPREKLNNYRKSATPKAFPSHSNPPSSQREATTSNSRKIRESSARFIELFAHGHYLSVCVAIRRQQAVANLWGRSESANGGAKTKIRLMVHKNWTMLSWALLFGRAGITFPENWWSIQKWTFNKFLFLTVKPSKCCWCLWKERKQN